MAEESVQPQSALAEAIHLLQIFRGADLTQTIYQIEKSVKGVSASNYSAIVTASGAKALGASNTGRAFDLETNLRVAEFKFIHWQGGPESIRQNALFKDFYEMAEHESHKEKYLYVLGTEHAERFLNGGRALSSVLSRNEALRKKFNEKHGNRYRTVRDYYLPRKGRVVIQDVSPFVPELVGAVEAAEGEEE